VANAIEAFAGSRFETDAIRYRHMSPVIANKTNLLQALCRNGDASALHTQHRREKLVCQEEAVRSGTIMRDQKPTAAALLKGVQTVASGRLRDLANNQVIVPVKQVSEVLVLAQLGLEDIEAATQCVARQLYNTFKGCTVNTEQSRETGQAFDTYGADFHGSTILHGSHEGNETAVDEVELLYCCIRVVDDVPSLQDHWSEMMTYALQLLDGQSQQNAIGQLKLLQLLTQRTAPQGRQSGRFF
jgi:hypothetical protein